MGDYFTGVFDTAEAAYREWLRHANESPKIFKIGEKWVVAPTEFQAKLKYLEPLTVHQLTREELRDINVAIVFREVDGGKDKK